MNYIHNYAILMKKTWHRFSISDDIKARASHVMLIVLDMLCEYMFFQGKYCCNNILTTMVIQYF